MASVVHETKTMIQRLFSPENINWWQQVHPIDKKVAILAPSGKQSQELIQVSDCTQPVPCLEHIKEELLQLYLGHHVSETFWSTLSSHVMHSISGPLFSYNDSMEASSEATLKSYLIEPVIRELTQHLNHLPVKPPEECNIFTASLSMEQKIPLHEGVGRPATVDFCIVLRQHSGKVVGVIPGEAKKMIIDGHVKQLSSYMWKIATSDAYVGRCVLGLLIDHENFQMAFSPLMFMSGKSVPVTYVAPRIRWRNAKISPTAVNRSSLLLLSTMLLANVTAKQAGSEFGYLEDVSKELYKKPLEFDSAPHDMKTSYVALMRDMEALQKAVTSLKCEKEKHEEEIRKLKEEDLKLKQTYQEEVRQRKEEDRRQKEDIQKQNMMMHVVQGVLIPRLTTASTPIVGTPQHSPGPVFSSRKRQRHYSDGDDL